jgi:hypothetical protein
VASPRLYTSALNVKVSPARTLPLLTEGDRTTRSGAVDDSVFELNSAGGVDWPCESSPQQATAPAVVIPHVWFQPTLIVVKVSPSGGISLPWKRPCPSLALPQQMAEPSARRPQVWRSPLPTAENVSPVGGRVTPKKLIPQQMAVP